jgi:hypothetical protein
MTIDYFDRVYCICMEDQKPRKERLFDQLNNKFPDLTPILFNAISTRHLKNHHLGCALSHRAVINDAKDKKYKRILVFEEDCILHKNIDNILPLVINELKTLKWDLFYPGACIWETKQGLPNRVFEKPPHCSNLVIPTGCTCTHGIAYNESIYDMILEQLPNNIENMVTWAKKHAAIDQWLMYHIQNQGELKTPMGAYRSYMSSPRVCSQPFLMGPKKQDTSEDFMLT